MYGIRREQNLFFLSSTQAEITFIFSYFILAWVGGRKKKILFASDPIDGFKIHLAHVFPKILKNYQIWATSRINGGIKQKQRYYVKNALEEVSNLIFEANVATV
jgi:hypothetical protein